MISKNKFYSDGYAHYKQLLKKSTIDSLSTELNQFSLLGRNPYIYESKVIQSVIFGNEVKNLAEQILGEKYIYLPDYTFNALNFWSSFGWHKDSVDRYDINGDDWDIKDFPIIRIGIYLGDYTKSTGSLGIQKSSNSGILYANRGINVKTVPGDIVVWPLTTTHTANSPSFKFFSNTAITPIVNSKTFRGLTNKFGNFTNKFDFFLQKKLPKRQVLFFTIARPGTHLAKYMSYLIHRDYFRNNIFNDPEQGELPQYISDSYNINWFGVKDYINMADINLVSNEFDQESAQASSGVLFSSFNEYFKKKF